MVFLSTEDKSGFIYLYPNILKYAPKGYAKEKDERSWN